MMKRYKILLSFSCIFIAAFLAAPVAAGLTVTDGDKITSPYGATSPVITVTDSTIPAGGTITIDVTYLYLFVNSGLFKDANVVVSSNSAAATWTGSVSGAGDMVTLTSAGGNTTVGENITVTFTGAAGNRWVTDTYGDQSTGLTITRTDTGETASINFRIETITPPPGGLAITDGATITAADGASSPVITIVDTGIPENGTIIIDVPYLWMYVKSGNFTTANVMVDDTAAGAIWTGTVSAVPGIQYSDYIILQSTGGPTAVGETVTVTFTGAGGNPWVPNTFGYQSMPVTVTRTDTFQTASLNFMIDIVPPPGGLTVTDGAKINTENGATSPVITIADSDIPAGGTITIDISGLNSYVASGSLTDANVEINDTAAAATWTRSVSGNILTLISNRGATVYGETITLTISGAGGNPWITNTHGEQTISLTAIRTDTSQMGTFNVVIDTAPPQGYLVVANFTASQYSESAPLTVKFTDTSTGNPTSWNWDFGDGATSAERNPVHTFADIGSYTVILTVSNAYGSDTLTYWDCIKVLNAGIMEADTSIAGLVTNCGRPQTISVDTSILPATLIPNNSVLVIQPPADSGFKNITVYAMSGSGFSRQGTHFIGKITGVHLESADIAPTSGFSGQIGPNASFNYSMDLFSYPCKAKLSTKIWEGAMTQYDIKFRQILDGNNAGSAGTAYMVRINKTNLPSGIRVKLRMSVDSGWNPSLPSGGGMMNIWRIADDGKSGQVLPTTFLYNDSVNNLDFYEADSPYGMSVFGLSAITGNNNPFQMVALVAAQAINSATGGGPSNAVTVQTTSTPEIKASLAPDPGKTAKIYTNADGVISQQTTLASNDGFANVSLGLGVVAKDGSGKPLTSISITRVADGNLPAGSPGPDLSFAGMAYEIQPDGVTFSPPVPIAFTIPQAKWGQEYVMQEYDHTSGTWKALESSYDPKTSVISTHISHLCCFALFAKTPAIENEVKPTPTTTIIVSSKSSIETNVQLYTWVISLIRQNPVILVIVVALMGVVAYFGWWKRRL